VNETTARRLVRQRSGGWCEVRLRGVCLGRAMSFHHRLRRSQGGPWTPSNGLDVCGDGTRGCHGALTNTNGRYDEYRRLGLILRSGDDPHTVPAVIHSPQYDLGERVALLLDDEGCVAWAPFPDGVEGDPFTLPTASREPDREWGAA